MREQSRARRVRRGHPIERRERVVDAQEKPRRRPQRNARLVDLRGRAPGDDLSQFLIEERARRSFGITGYLLSGGGAGAVTCWFQIGALYTYRAPAVVLRLLLIASGVLLAAVVVGFLAALAGYKAFDIAASMSAEDLGRPYNRADRWMSVTVAARIVAAGLLTIGGLTAFAAYYQLSWR
jgi:hypothetical protein